MPFAKAFERQTSLPVTVIDTDEITLSDDVRSQLHINRVKFEKQTVTFNHKNVTIPNQFITSTKASFECLLMHNSAGSMMPKLTAGIKMPDEYYLDTTQKNVFIIEKKTQQEKGSVDEKIQAAAFKQLILRKKFNPDETFFTCFAFRTDLNMVMKRNWSILTK
jgi:hypothetical protein